MVDILEKFPFKIHSVSVDHVQVAEGDKVDRK